MQYTSQKISKIFSHGDDIKSEELVKYLLEKGETVIPILSELLNSEEGEVRWWSIRALSEFPDPPIDRIIEKLKDKSQEVRQCSVLALCYHPTTDAMHSLLSLMNDVDPFISNLAATALIAIGDEVIPDLLEVVEGLEGRNKIEGFRVLASIKDERSVPILMSGLTSLF